MIATLIGATETSNWPARGFEQRFDIFDLALPGVRKRIPALASPAAVIVDDGVVFREQFGETLGATLIC